MALSFGQEAGFPSTSHFDKRLISIYLCEHRFSHSPLSIAELVESQKSGVAFKVTLNPYIELPLMVSWETLFK